MENIMEINDGHYLELMDRLHIACSMINDHILPYFEKIGEYEVCKELYGKISHTLTNSVDYR